MALACVAMMESAMAYQGISRPASRYCSVVVVRRLRRGEYRVESEIDLHGLTVVEARAQLRAFLAEATARRLRCVRIVHGKGLRSGQRGPVIKQTVNALLRRVGAVIAFSSARQVAGAVYVLLG